MTTMRSTILPVKGFSLKLFDSKEGAIFRSDSPFFYASFSGVLQAVLNLECNSDGYVIS